MTRRLFLATLFCLLVAASAIAQTTAGSITGTVVDPTGAVIPGAKVTVEGVGKVLTTETDRDGQFAVPGLPYGVYKVSVEAPGFRRTELPDIVVEVARSTVIRPRLEVGAVTETVVVAEGQEVINTVSAELTTTVDRKQITELPLVTRNPVNLAGLQAGVAVTTTVRNAIISGVRGQSTNITQDGINVQDNYIRNDGLFALSAPSVEATGEFTIITNNLSADSGSGLAQVRIATTRGTDDFHGSVFYFHRNDAFAANTWSNNSTGTEKERLRQHRFGYSVGGPVYIPKIYDGRERTYFFHRYEGFREHFASTENRTVLTPEARQGLFRYYRQDNGAIETVDLLAVSSRGFGLNPVTMELINATPLPNNDAVGDGLNTRGHRFNVLGSDPNNAFTFRFDHKVVDSQRYGTHWVEVSYNRYKSRLFPDTFNDNEAPFPAGVATSCPGAMCLSAGQQSNRKVLAVAIQSSFGGTKTNEARWGFNRAPVTFTREAAFPRAFRLDFPLITDPEQNFLDQGRIAPFYTFIDNFSWVKGSHNLKFGFQIHSRNVSTFNDSGIVPEITIGTNSINSSGLASASFPSSTSTIRSVASDVYEIVTGLLQDVTQTFNALPAVGAFIDGAGYEEQAREREYDLFAQDSWRVRPSFTLNFGLRWEFVRPVDIVSNNALQPVGLLDGMYAPYAPGPLFTPDPSITFSDLLTGTAQATQLDLAPRRGLWNEDWNNFAPFIGIAWSPSSDNAVLKTLFGQGGKGALRSGFSVSYLREGLTVAIQPLRSNDGLTLDAGYDATGVLTSAGLPVTPPTYSMPVDMIDNWLDTGANAGMFTFDPEMRTPYVLQWNLSYQREIAPQTRLELRYVGNHGVKLIRAIDIGQIDILGNGMLDEFLLAQQNLACNRANGQERYDNRGFACNVPLPLLEGMNWPYFTSSARIGNVERGEIGEFMHQAARYGAYYYLATGGASFAGLANYPANFFRINGFTILDDFVGNNSDSNYHAFQVEVVRRFSRGLFFQGNYTFGKAIADFDGDVQNTFRPHLSITDIRHQRARASYDITHAFNFNSVWEIPVGRGRAYLSEGPLGKVLEGWQVGGVWTWRSGRPVGIFSERGTFNRNARSGTGSAGNPAVLLDRSVGDVCGDVGVYREGGGAFYLPASYRDVSGRASDTIFGHPGAGELGDSALRYFCSGPSNFNVDLNLVKKTGIKERMWVEFRAEFFNIFNTPNFLPTQLSGITSSSFAQITNVGSTFAPREIQFNIRILW